MKKMKQIPTLNKTQNVFFNLCLAQYDEFEGGEPTMYQQDKLIEFIKEFPLLEQTNVMNQKGNYVNKAKVFHIWWKENFEEIYQILFVYVKLINDL